MSSKHILSPAQCRAARGLLAWSQAELAKAARLGLSSLRNLETMRHPVRDDQRQAIRSALEAAGVEFIDTTGRRGAVLSGLEPEGKAEGAGRAKPTAARPKGAKSTKRAIAVGPKVGSKLK